MRSELFVFVVKILRLLLSTIIPAKQQNHAYACFGTNSENASTPKKSIFEIPFTIFVLYSCTNDNTYDEGFCISLVFMMLIIDLILCVLLTF